MADLLIADPVFVGNIFILIAIGIGAAIILIILLKAIDAMGGNE